MGRLLGLFLGLLVCTSMTGAGCKGEEPAKPAAVQKRLAPPQPAQPIPQPEQDPGPEAVAGPLSADLMPLTEPQDEESQAAADAIGMKRDPFRSFIEVRDPTAVAVRKAPTRPLTPLERYSLDQLSLVGVVGGGSMQKALLEDDVGKGYVVGVGAAVGNQGGRIVSIQPDRIVIQETTTDPLGEERVRNITKRLYAVDRDG